MRLSARVWSGRTIGSRTPSANTVGMVSRGRSSTNVARAMVLSRLRRMRSQCAETSSVLRNPPICACSGPDAAPNRSVSRSFCRPMKRHSHW